MRFLSAKGLAVWAIAVALAAIPRSAACQTTSPVQAPSAAGSVVRPIGTIKAISGNSITLVTDSGSTVSITVQDSARMVRTAPGQKDLQGATPVTLNDLKVGDRMVARGKMSDDGKTVEASSVIIMTGADIAAKQDRDREDWQKRGAGGLVKEVNAAAGTVTITATGAGGTKTTVVHVSKDTVIRRYAPDSVRFDDAKPGTLDQIQPGDQLRARGARNADGGELTAEEIVSGKFRNVAGTVLSTDIANNSVTVQDLLTKSKVTLQIGSDSQLRNLPTMVAQRIATRFKGGAQGAAGAAPQNADANPGSAPAGGSGMKGGGAGGGFRSGGAPDFQQMLDRMPAVTLADLQKGVAVMAVATEGSASAQPTAITLLTGVEPILTAAPDAKGAAMMLSPWNLGGAEAAGANQ